MERGILYSSVLDIEKVKGFVKGAFEDEIQALNITSLGDGEVKELLDNVTSESLKDALERQKILSSQFFQEMNEEKKKKRGKK